jgi:hypothetical protein
MSQEEATAKAQNENKEESDDEDVPGLETDASGKKLNRGEKKCRKALLKQGMK